MRLIDADALLAAYDSQHEGPPGKARTLIEEAPTVGGWISVGDGRPAEPGWYLVYAPEYIKSAGKREWYDGLMFAKWNGKSWSIERGYYDRPGCVKYWIPMPEHPAEGDGDEHDVV